MPRYGSSETAQLPRGSNGHALHKRATPQPWKASGNCVGIDPDLFYPEDRGAAGRDAVAQARAVCQGCPVRLQCLAYALANAEEYGIWGGCTERERRKMRRLLVALRATDLTGVA